MPNVDINTKMEVWGNKLLNLGKRNRLLNYRKTKRSSLKILSPFCLGLYCSFVQNEQPLVFPNLTEYLKVSDKTVRRLIASKSLIASKIGSTWRIKRADIEDCLASNSNGNFAKGE